MPVRPSVQGCLFALALVSICYALFFPSAQSGQVPFRPSTRTSAGTTTASQRIVAVGDIHGDLPNLRRVLQRAELIDERDRWIGGKATLVQTGDIVDRGPDTIALYRFFDALRPQAADAGGALVSLLGNHELMNAFGDWRYVTKEDIDSFGGIEKRKATLSTGWIGQTWRSNYSITARVPIRSDSQVDLPLDDCSAASFVHGGITPSYIKSLRTGDPVAKINEIGHGLLVKLVSQNDPHSLRFPRDSTAEEREFWSERGPMWDRTYALDEDDSVVCAHAREAARLLRVRHLVMGHTPFFEGIQQRCDGLVLLIDTGISHAYGGSLSALEIMTEWTRHENGTWREVETSSALYTDHRSVEVLARHERLLS